MPVKAGRHGEAARMGESNSSREKLSKAALGCHNKGAQGTFSWVPPWVRSSVAPHMAELTLPSGEWRSSTLVFLMPKVLWSVCVSNVSFHAQEQRTAVSGN